MLVGVMEIAHHDDVRGRKVDEEVAVGMCRRQRRQLRTLPVDRHRSTIGKGFSRTTLRRNGGVDPAPWTREVLGHARRRIRRRDNGGALTADIGVAARVIRMRVRVHHIPDRLLRQLRDLRRQRRAAERRLHQDRAALSDGEDAVGARRDQRQSAAEIPGRRNGRSSTACAAPAAGPGPCARAPRTDVKSRSAADTTRKWLSK